MIFESMINVRLYDRMGPRARRTSQPQPSVRGDAGWAGVPPQSMAHQASPRTDGYGVAVRARGPWVRQSSKQKVKRHQTMESMQKLCIDSILRCRLLQNIRVYGKIFESVQFSPRAR